MPQVAAIPLFTVFAGGAATTITLGAVAGYLATTAITSWAISALTPKPDLGNIGGSRGTLVNSVDPAAPHEYVYGIFRKGGIRTYTESTGTDNKFLHLVISMAGHEVDGFVAFYVNDEVVTVDGNGFVTSAPWNSKIRILAHRGNQTSVTDNFANASTNLQSTLLAESNQIDANFVGRGIAYMYIRLEYDQDVFANGIPLFTALIKGRKVYDPRDTSTTHSANAALCIRDYLTADFGLNDQNVDDVSFAASAHVCDEPVSLVGVGSEKRYEAHGVVSADMTPQEIVNRLITSCAGTLFWGQGNFQLKAGYYTNPVKTFTLDDIRSTISIDTRIASRDNFNRVVGTFADADVDYIVSEFPAMESDKFLIEDNGIENTLDLQLPFTTSASMAQRLAKLTLFRGREQITVSADFGLSAFEVQAGDNVALTIERYGWDAKPFEVTGWNFKYEDGDLRVSMTLRETSFDAFKWEAEEAQIIYNNTNLPNAYDVPLPTLNAAQASVEINEDGTAVPSIRFSWSVTDDSRVQYYDFQWKLSTDSVWQSAQVSGTEYTLSPAISGAAYDYRVRAVNQIGYRSDFVSSAGPVSTGSDGTTPNAPTGLTATAGATSIKLSWTAPTANTDASQLDDLFQYKIYRATVNNSASASLIGRLAGDVFTDGSLVGGETYYYWVSALDYTGNESAKSGVAFATAAAIEDTRNKGVYYIGVTTLPTTSSGANTDFVAAIGTPSEGAQAWFYTGTLENPTAQTVWIFNGSTWDHQTKVIDGNLLVSDTVTADAMAANSITAENGAIANLSVDRIKLVTGAVTERYNSQFPQSFDVNQDTNTNYGSYTTAYSAYMNGEFPSKFEYLGQTSITLSSDANLVPHLIYARHYLTRSLEAGLSTTTSTWHRLTNEVFVVTKKNGSFLKVSGWMNFENAISNGYMTGQLNQDVDTVSILEIGTDYTTGDVLTFDFYSYRYRSYSGYKTGIFGNSINMDVQEYYK